jgi:hypothetical protein
MIANIDFSINYQLERVEAKYKKEIRLINVLRDKKDEFYKLLVELTEANRDLKGTSHLLPF